MNQTQKESLDRIQEELTNKTIELEKTKTNLNEEKDNKIKSLI